MSIYDRFRDLADKLLTGTFRVSGTLTSIKREYHRPTDTNIITTTPQPCVAIIGKRKLASENVRLSDIANGAVMTETVARLNVKPSVGDKLTVGTHTYTIASYEELAPDGGEPMLWVAVLKQ